MASLTRRFPADCAVQALVYGKGASVTTAAAATIRAAAVACAADKAARCAGKEGGAATGEVLLYYKYVAVGDPPALRAWQLSLCSALDLRGRVHVGAEGINGTVGGTREATRLYVEAMNCHPVWVVKVTLWLVIF